MMKTYKKKNIKINDECTSVVFCTGDSAPNDSWTECDELELVFSTCTQLYLQAGVRYYGYL